MIIERFCVCYVCNISFFFVFFSVIRRRRRECRLSIPTTKMMMEKTPGAVEHRNSIPYPCKCVLHTILEKKKQLALYQHAKLYNCNTMYIYICCTAINTDREGMEMMIASRNYYRYVARLADHHRRGRRRRRRRVE